MMRRPFCFAPVARAIVTATSASVRFCKAHTLGLPAKTKRVKPANGRPLSERRVALFWLRSKLDNGALRELGTGPILKNGGPSAFSTSSISRQSFERHDGISVPMVAQPVRLTQRPAFALFWATELAVVADLVFLSRDSGFSAVRVGVGRLRSRTARNRRGFRVL